LSSEEAAHKAVELLDKQELDGRSVIVEIAKPADQKDRERKQRTKRRPGRRGARAVPGEVSEAEAANEVKPEGVELAPTDPAAKLKKRKKKSPVGRHSLSWHIDFNHILK
jgi:RNA recognition motif-containing protein